MGASPKRKPSRQNSNSPAELVGTSADCRWRAYQDKLTGKMGESIKDFYRNKVVLVTGAAGTVCKEVIRKLIGLEPAKTRVVDNNETELFHLDNKYQHTGKVTPYVGSFRYEQKII